MTQRVSILLAVVGWAAMVAGVVMLAGAGWALLVAGLLAVVAAGVLYDPDARKKP